MGTNTTGASEEMTARSLLMASRSNISATPPRDVLYLQPAPAPVRGGRQGEPQSVSRRSIEFPSCSPMPARTSARWAGLSCMENLQWIHLSEEEASLGAGMWGPTVPHGVVP